MHLINMGKVSTRLPGFCLSRMRSHVRVRSPVIQSNKINSGNNVNSDAVKNDEQKVKVKVSSGVEEKEGSSVIINGRKIMIVVDSSVEAKAALLWALSHTVQSQDLLILLHVTKPSKLGTSEKDSTKDRASRGYEVVNSLKRLCQLKRPEIEIETEVVFGKEKKGEIIVEQAKIKGAGLLVIGQKKRSMTWRLIMMWAKASSTGGGGGGVVEYCIQNAECMAVAVRRKSQKHGGFLITTKRHKDFWLLA